MTAPKGVRMKLVAVEARGREGEGPREEETQESRGDARPQKCGSGRSSRQRDETPEARPCGP